MLGDRRGDRLRRPPDAALERGRLQRAQGRAAGAARRHGGPRRGTSRSPSSSRSADAPLVLSSALGVASPTGMRRRAADHSRCCVTFRGRGSSAAACAAFPGRTGKIAFIARRAPSGRVNSGRQRPDTDHQRAGRTPHSAMVPRRRARLAFTSTRADPNPPDVHDRTDRATARSTSWTRTAPTCDQSPTASASSTRPVVVARRDQARVRAYDAPHLRRSTWDGTDEQRHHARPDPARLARVVGPDLVARRHQAGGQRHRRSPRTTSARSTASWASARHQVMLTTAQAGATPNRRTGRRTRTASCSGRDRRRPDGHAHDTADRQRAYELTDGTRLDGLLRRSVVSGRAARSPSLAPPPPASPCGPALTSWTPPMARI